MSGAQVPVILDSSLGYVVNTKYIAFVSAANFYANELNFKGKKITIPVNFWDSSFGLF